MVDDFTNKERDLGGDFIDCVFCTVDDFTDKDLIVTGKQIGRAHV